jgi:crotonobetainyl-CoA:carnitine CoA-transferase CaiB-like acyl-CoA transferase
VATLSSGTAGRQEVEIVASPLKLGETPTVAGTMPPRLGEHTDALLSERLGLSGREIAELRAAGALGRSKGPTD